MQSKDLFAGVNLRINFIRINFIVALRIETGIFNGYRYFYGLPLFYVFFKDLRIYAIFGKGSYRISV